MLAVLLVGLTACAQPLSYSHTETPCIVPGQTVTLKSSTEAGAQLSYKVQDDFGGDLGSIGPIAADSTGDASVPWKSPRNLSTTTLHFLLTAIKGDKRVNQDIHVVVGGNGRSC